MKFAVSRKKKKKWHPNCASNFFRLKQQVMKLIFHVTRANKTSKMCVTLPYEAKDDQEKWFLSLRDGTRQHYRLSINLWVERGKKRFENKFKLAKSLRIKLFNLRVNNSQRLTMLGQWHSFRLLESFRLSTFIAMRLFQTTMHVANMFLLHNWQQAKRNDSNFYVMMFTFLRERINLIW